ncbi:MAG: hypothetical protein DRP35_01870 [Candidatus Zixiibacteriota bacterium]|nr:MAG: hypothetical protein DRP35_01870 [candidate division Zixibacteria bacterium]
MYLALKEFKIMKEFMKKYNITVLIVLVLILMSSSSFALDPNDINDDAGTSAFPFLKINIGARAVAMGGAFTGLANDESALYYNPAGISTFDENNQYILGYHNYFVDIQSGFIGFIKPINNELNIGGYISYLNYGEFIETNQLGEVTGDFSGSDYLMAVSGSYKLNYYYSVGLTFKAIYEKIQDFSSHGIAFDIGFKYTGDRERFTAGLAIQNIGTQLSGFVSEKYSLPLTVRGGISIKPRGLPLLLATDLIIPKDNSMDLAIGAEYIELEPIYLRMGWNSFGNNFKIEGSDAGFAGLSFGLGFNFNNEKQISYSFSPSADLGDSHRITLTGSM